MIEHCAICNCVLHRKAGTYAMPTVEGRSHATKHHFVAERCFGRSRNRRGPQIDGVFDSCPWGYEGASNIFCYECHEELLHNPVLLPQDIVKLAAIVRSRGLEENYKPEDRKKIAGRIKLFHEIISKGINAIAENEKQHIS